MGLHFFESYSKYANVTLIFISDKNLFYYKIFRSFIFLTIDWFFIGPFIFEVNYSIQ